MGGVLKAKCRCGFKTRELHVGLGERDVGMVYSLPVACSTCKRIWLAEQNLAEFICRDPKPPLYLLHGTGNHTADRKTPSEFPWDTEGANTVLYRCPRCGKLEMTLTVVAQWIS